MFLTSSLHKEHRVLAGLRTKTSKWLGSHRICFLSTILLSFTFFGKMKSELFLNNKDNKNQPIKRSKLNIHKQNPTSLLGNLPQGGGMSPPYSGRKTISAAASLMDDRPDPTSTSCVSCQPCFEPQPCLPCSYSSLFGFSL